MRRCATNSTRGAMRGHGSGRSGTDRSRGRRVAQDSPPTAYMYTPSGAKDAQISRPAQGVPLPEPWPHVGRQTALSITKWPTSNAKQAAGHCHKGRDLVDCWKSQSGGMADAADLKSAAW